MNYPRRQQYCRLSRAGSAAAGSGAAVLLALVLASVGAISLAGPLLLTAVALGLYTRYWLGLARRSRVGAQSENEVRRVLAALEAEGWRVRHGLRWRGPGDVDLVAIAPGGIGFAIEIKTRSYDDRHLMRVREQAAWLSRRRRRWCRRGALPVVCVVRDRGVQRWEQGALVVSIDQLTSTLRSAAGGCGALERVRLLRPQVFVMLLLTSLLSTYTMLLLSTPSSREAHDGFLHDSRPA